MFAAKSHYTNRLFFILGAVFIVSAGAAHAHGLDHSSHDRGERLHFSHPLITESPSPDTKVRLDYFFRDIDEPGEEGQDSTIRLEVEYAFTREFSVELNIPYVFTHPDGGPSENDLDNIEIALKFANFAFEDKGLLLGYGIEFGLPTGDGPKGIGSNHEFEFEPFFNVGYKLNDLEIVSFVSFGIPINQNGEEVETELGYNLSLLYPVNPRFAALLELDLETVLSGDKDGTTVVNLTPGVKVSPFSDKAMAFGVGVSFPISDTEEFNTQVVASVFYHF
ncbi:MAG: transporter [Candidatus Hydrogenedentes bacterium]|nr:transporter [Candidatus Hydrogenedentota bacterium]